eukprot:493706-Heterocapsa_arctica.AAC.1
MSLAIDSLSSGLPLSRTCSHMDLALALYTSSAGMVKSPVPLSIQSCWRTGDQKMLRRMTLWQSGQYQLKADPSLHRVGMSLGLVSAWGFSGVGSPCGLQGPPNPLARAHSAKVASSGIRSCVMIVCWRSSGSGWVKKALGVEPPA